MEPGVRGAWARPKTTPKPSIPSSCCLQPARNLRPSTANPTFSKHLIIRHFLATNAPPQQRKKKEKDYLTQSNPVRFRRESQSIHRRISFAVGCLISPLPSASQYPAVPLPTNNQTEPLSPHHNRPNPLSSCTTSLDSIASFDPSQQTKKQIWAATLRH